MSAGSANGPVGRTELLGAMSAAITGRGTVRMGLVFRCCSRAGARTGSRVRRSVKPNDDQPQRRELGHELTTTQMVTAMRVQGSAVDEERRGGFERGGGSRRCRREDGRRQVYRAPTRSCSARNTKSPAVGKWAVGRTHWTALKRGQVRVSTTLPTAVATRPPPATSRPPSASEASGRDCGHGRRSDPRYGNQLSTSSPVVWPVIVGRGTRISRHRSGRSAHGGIASHRRGVHSGLTATATAVCNSHALKRRDIGAAPPSEGSLTGGCGPRVDMARGDRRRANEVQNDARRARLMRPGVPRRTERGERQDEFGL